MILLIIIALVFAVLFWHRSRLERYLDQVLEIEKKISAATRDGDQTIIMWELDPWLRAELASVGFNVTRDGNFWLISW